MKTDTIFYRLFQEIPSTFFELIGESPELAENYEFSSVEVEETAFNIDGVFLPKETTENPIQFLENSNSIRRSNSQLRYALSNMKTDTIFYRLFQEIPSIFFELIGESPELAENYDFSSVEVKQTAFRIDGVFLPKETTDNPIHFLEVQFQPDENLYSRLFAEISLYLHQNQPQNGWKAVVIYPTRSIDVGNIENYEEFFLSQRVRVIYLDEIEETKSLPIGIATIKLIISKPDIAITQAKELINRTKQEVKSQPKQQQILELIETILIYKLPKMKREEIESMFGLSDLKQTRFYQEALEEGRQEGKEEGKEEGKKEGKKEGRQEGELKAKLEAVPGLVGLGLSQAQIAQVLNLSIDEVKKIVNKMSK